MIEAVCYAEGELIMAQILTQFLKPFYVIQKKYSDLKISMKIMLVYFVFMILSLSFSSYIYQKIYYNIISRKVSEISLQTLYSIKSNINSMISDISNDSKLILSNDEIQTALRNANSSENVKLLMPIKKFMAGIIEAMPDISSICIFDNYGHKYDVNDYPPLQSIKYSQMKRSQWYQDALHMQGYYVLKRSSEMKNIGGNNANVVSFIRIINDLNTQRPIGVLIISINGSRFENCYKDIINKYETNISLLDRNNRSIVSRNHYPGVELSRLELQLPASREHSSVTKKINGKDYILSSVSMAEYGWRIISSIPFQELSKESSQFGFIALVVIIVNGILLFAGAILISNRITKPIKKLLKSMKGMERGEFKRVNIKAGNDEIGKLQDGYNMMISEIQKLINRIINEQKVKRRAELNVLQAQIKPHFLYNTLDAMGYLALSGKCEEVYDALEALGNYYRTSLSKGSEVITVREEIDIVKNYLALQKLRYGEIFSDRYEVDERIYQCKILKLVLQPLVENALYHGIKPKGEHGNISVRAVLIEDSIVLSVEDDGVGMSPETLELVANYRIDQNLTSLGLRETIERIRLFYGLDNVYDIESTKNVGTKITITIPFIPTEGCAMDDYEQAKAFDRG